MVLERWLVWFIPKHDIFSRENLGSSKLLQQSWCESNCPRRKEQQLHDACWIPGAWAPGARPRPPAAATGHIPFRTCLGLEKELQHEQGTDSGDGKPMGIYRLAAGKMGKNHLKKKKKE